MISDLNENIGKLFPAWEKLSATAQKSTKPLYLVGGALRDLLRGETISDLDFTCRAEDMAYWEASLLNITKGRFITMGAEKFRRAKKSKGVKSLFLTKLLHGDRLCVALWSLPYYHLP